MTGASDTLEVIGGKIQAYLKRSDDQRLSAAMLIAEAKARIDAGEMFEPPSVKDNPQDEAVVYAALRAGPTWQSYCALYIQRSDRDIRRLLAVARSDDPVAAVAADRERNRAAVAAHRSRTYVSPVSLSPIVATDAQLAALLAKMTDAWKQAPSAEFRSALTERLEAALVLPSPVAASAAPHNAEQAAAPGLTCNAPGGDCRYGMCRLTGRCAAHRRAA
jgi:hypothetical protein